MADGATMTEEEAVEAALRALDESCAAPS